jgi:hypothetical protein
MRVFDYVYYRIYRFYEGFNESGPWAFGIPAMAMSQFFTLMSIDRVLEIIGFSNFLYIKGSTGNVIIVGILIFNFVRYYWLVPYSALSERWHSESKSQKIWKGLLTLFYLFGSLFTMLYLTGFFNRKIGH